jgi:hypothetical protein
MMAAHTRGMNGGAPAKLGLDNCGDRGRGISVASHPASYSAVARFVLEIPQSPTAFFTTI